MRNNQLKKLSTTLAPILGVGGIGACSISCMGSATLLTFIGLGAIAPFWSWISFGLILLGALGLIIDYNTHRKPWPTILLVLGGIVLYFGRYYVNGEEYLDWLVWSLGAILIITSVFYNRLLLNKKNLEI